jgi:hypothetical protein
MGKHNYPSFTPTFRAMTDYYKLEFDEHGYPCQIRENELYKHPIYGVYVLKDYLKQYNQNSNVELLDAIIRLADLVYEYMESHLDSKVFWYEADFKVGRAIKRHYSGLTQSYYSQIFYEVYLKTNKHKYKTAAFRIFRSLLVSSQNNGVLYRWNNYTSIAELPMIPNGLILNGWLTILNNVHKFYIHTKFDDARGLFEDSTKSLTEILPLYDSVENYNSRYSLTGPIIVKLVFKKNHKLINISNIKLSIPGVESINVNPNTHKHFWNNYIFNEDIEQVAKSIRIKSRTLRLNLVCSRLSFPLDNTLQIYISSDQKIEFDFFCYSGKYDPLSSSQIDRKWEFAGRYFSENNSGSFDLSIPWKFADLIAYPTNFKKRIKNKNYNVYHFIHIRILDQLYKITNITKLKYHSELWLNYTKEWKKMDIYNKVEHISHTEV